MTSDDIKAAQNKARHLKTIHYKLAKEYFIDTADENYMCFRGCLLNRLDHEVSWQAAHAVEKYIKAALLLNGKSIKKTSHDIRVLYQKLLEIAPNLLPDTLGSSTKIKTTQLIKILNRNGSPSNRYGASGYRFRTQDMLLVDQLVFAIRRLCCDLDDSVQDDMTLAQKLEKEPNWGGILENQRKWQPAVTFRSSYKGSTI